MRYLLVLLLLASCASAPDRSVSEEELPDCITGIFQARNPLRPVSLPEAIDTCDAFCESRGKTMSDVVWVNKGQQVGCRCSCRRIEDDKGRGPKE